MKPKRVAYVIGVFPKLSETFVANQIAEVRRRGAEVRILSLRRPTEELRHSVVIEERLEQYAHYNPEDFLQIVRDFNPDLLHAHFATQSAQTARELSAATAIPFSFTAHRYDIFDKAPADFAERAAAARLFATVSQHNAQYIARTFGVPESMMRVIPCGVDVEYFRPPTESAPTSDPPLVVCVARHAKAKNLGLLLKACAELHHRVPFKCVLVGDGPLRQELESLRDSLKLQDVVIMPGPATQEQVRQWWHQAAVAVLPSDSEGMPVCLMEAAACGLPAVATAVGGVPELVEDGVTGLVTRSGDEHALASALERILRAPELRRRMGLAARAKAEATLSLKRQVDCLFELWEELLARADMKPRFEDPFKAAGDPALPTLVNALDFAHAEKELKRGLPRLCGPDGKLKLRRIRVTRHKPGRRCVVEYDVRLDRPDQPPEWLTVIGKVRARRFGNEGYRLLEQIWNAGFSAESPDGISVPEPLGVIAAFKMWFQRKVRGKQIEFSGTKGVQRARRVAEGVEKLHRANVPTERRHDMADELRVLRGCFDKLRQQQPALAARLDRILAECEKVGARVGTPQTCGIHRDFYPAQILEKHGRLYLIDFDLYCMGDPALDIGNFVGHIKEEALRDPALARDLEPAAAALEERFYELAGPQHRAGVDAYTTLTLARHIYLSTLFPERAHCTVALMDLCEERMSIGSRAQR